jgi:hypothetical protein
MFGHDSHNDNNQDDNQAVVMGDVNPPTSLPAPTNDSLDPPRADNNHAGAPAMNIPADGHLDSSDDTSTSTSPALSSSSDDTLPPDHGDTDNLLNIKQQALQQLSPLVGHLDQTPEEKFRTTMMMIQASDDQSLIDTAYDAAKQIPDEKTRAQALLDVVNEINYFTQQANQ